MLPKRFVCEVIFIAEALKLNDKAFQDVMFQCNLHLICLSFVYHFQVHFYNEDSPLAKLCKMIQARNYYLFKTGK